MGAILKRAVAGAGVVLKTKFRVLGAVLKSASAGAVLKGAGAGAVLKSKIWCGCGSETQKITTKKN